MTGAACCRVHRDEDLQFIGMGKCFFKGMEIYCSQVWILGRPCHVPPEGVYKSCMLSCSQGWRIRVHRDGGFVFTGIEDSCSQGWRIRVHRNGVGGFVFRNG